MKRLIFGFQLLAVDFWFQLLLVSVSFHGPARGCPPRAAPGVLEIRNWGSRGPGEATAFSTAFPTASVETAAEMLAARVRGGGWSRVPLSGPLSGRAPPCGSVPGDALRAGPETAGRAGSRGDETEAALFTHVPENSVPGRKQRAGPATACRAGNRGDETEAALFMHVPENSGPGRQQQAGRAGPETEATRRRRRCSHARPIRGPPCRAAAHGGFMAAAAAREKVRDSIWSGIRFARPFDLHAPSAPAWVRAGRAGNSGPGREQRRRDGNSGPGRVASRVRASTAAVRRTMKRYGHEKQLKTEWTNSYGPVPLGSVRRRRRCAGALPRSGKEGRGWGRGGGGASPGGVVQRGLVPLYLRGRELSMC